MRPSGDQSALTASATTLVIRSKSWPFGCTSPLLIDDRSDLLGSARALITALLWPAAIAVGLLAESTGFGWGDPRQWSPDLAVGWSFIGCGLASVRRRPESRSGALLVATGFAWFLGNFANAGLEVVAWIGAHLLFLYRGPLIQLVLTYPSGRTRSWVTGSAIAFGWPRLGSSSRTVAGSRMIPSERWRSSRARLGEARCPSHNPGLARVDPPVPGFRARPGPSALNRRIVPRGLCPAGGSLAEQTNGVSRMTISSRFLTQHS
jgi:hypothetical protein